MYVQALHIGEVRLVIIDFNGQYDAVAITIKIGGNHFEIERQIVAIERMVNRRCQRKAVGAIGIQGQGKDSH